MKKIATYFIVAGLLHFMPGKIHAQSKDTLAPVKVFSKKPWDITTATTNVQQLDKAMLTKLNSVSVADAIKYFSGVVVKDYGGIGGLKTVSVRSLGANHTGIMYDGIMIADAQGGQIDLGRFSLDNIESVQLFNDQPANILLPARSYASASVIALSSSAAANDENKTNGSVKMRAGSFGFINPSVYFKTRLTKKLSLAASIEYQYAKGDYSFIDYETSKAKKTRSNSDIKTYRAEFDAAYRFNDSNWLKSKLYYYNSKRGLPGSVILYNSFSNQRLNNESFFSQSSWQKTFSGKSRILISGKYSSDYKYYLDPSYQNAAGKLENKFHQKEFYLSAAYNYKILAGLSASYAVDYFKTTLKRTDEFAFDFANPQRDHLLNNIAVQWKRKRLEANANLLHSFFTSNVEHGPVAKDMHELTPAFSVSLQPAQNFPLRLRASYKNIFRAPTFDDLYYTNFGNSNLKPEYAKQYSAGITVNLQPGCCFRDIIFTADAYYNHVKDKIIAVPRQNLFQWTTLNIDIADIKGIDAAAHINFIEWHQIQTAINFSYSYQQALDKSNPSAVLYNTQLPYIPEHSGSMNLDISYQNFSFSYNMLSSSYRYQLGIPGPENVVQGWTTHDLSLAYTFFSKKHWRYKLLAELNNIYNLQYEIIKYYPMQRFNYRLGIVADFKK